MQDTKVNYWILETRVEVMLIFLNPTATLSTERVDPHTVAPDTLAPTITIP